MRKVIIMLLACLLIGQSLHAQGVYTVTKYVPQLTAYGVDDFGMPAEGQANENFLTDNEQMKVTIMKNMIMVTVRNASTGSQLSEPKTYKIVMKLDTQESPETGIKVEEYLLEDMDAKGLNGHRFAYLLSKDGRPAQLRVLTCLTDVYTF